MADRRPLDAYYTDDRVARALVGLLPIAKGSVVWEPHAGGGAFVQALLRIGCAVAASDIDPEAPGLWQVIIAGRDRFESEVSDALKPYPFAGSPQWVVGNPPFSGFEAHLDAALSAAPNVAFLLRLAVMESSGRVDAWKRWPLRHVWVLAERPSFTGGKTDSCAYGFFRFERGFLGAATVSPGFSWRTESVPPMEVLS